SSRRRKILHGERMWLVRLSIPPPGKARCCMPAANPIVSVIREWIVKAENDLLTAAHTLTLGKDCPTDTVSFHAQQCVEKYIKALLVYKAIPFPKTHKIGDLRALL